MKASAAGHVDAALRRDRDRRLRVPAIRFLLPAVVLFGVLYALPTLGAVPLSFTNWNGIGNLAFVGAQNFLAIGQSGAFVHALWHNVLFFAAFFVLVNVVAMGLALLINLHRGVLRMAATMVAGGPRRRVRGGRLVGRGLVHLVLILYSLFAILPLLITVFASFKSQASFFSDPFSMPDSLLWSNYGDAWAQGNLAQAFLNSVIVTVVSVVVSTVGAGLAAYSLVRFRPRVGGTIQLAFISGMMVPAVVIIIPTFVLMNLMHLVGTIWSIVVPYCGFLLPLAFLIFVNFLRTVPKELSEAALIDGCTHNQVFWRIELPLLRPAIATIVILNGVSVWNDFLLPLVLGTTDSLHTVPVAIVSFFGVYSTAYNLVFASVILASLPVILLYVLLSRQFIEGIAAGALK